MGAPMSKVRIILVLLLAAAASHAVARFHAESVVERVAAVAPVAERSSLAIVAEAAIMLAAILAVAAWDWLKPLARPKSEAPVGGSADAAQAKERG
jgi:hypothetical protein